MTVPALLIAVLVAITAASAIIVFAVLRRSARNAAEINQEMREAFALLSRDALRETNASLLQYSGNVDDVKRNTTRALERGYKHIKLHEHSIEVVAAAREAIGADVSLMVDTNCYWDDPGTIVTVCKELAPYDVAWLEEPLPAEDLGCHVELAVAATMPIAVGESLYHLSHFREYLERGACSIVQVDCARIGGITPWLKVAHLAEAFNVAVCPHFLMELHVSLCAAVPNAAWVEWIPQLDDITTSRLAIVDGKATPPSAPGLGIAWDWQAIAKLQAFTPIVLNA